MVVRQKMNLSILLQAALGVVILCLVKTGQCTGNEIEILTIEDCSNPETATIKFSAQLELKNSTTPVASGTLDVSKTIDDNIQCKGIVDMKTDMGWKENFISVDTKNKGVCTTMKEYLGNDWTRILKSADPPLADCPIQPNVYKGKDILATKEIGVTPLKSGKYRFTMRCHHSENEAIEIACLKCDVDSRPLKRPSSK